MTGQRLAVVVLLLLVGVWGAAAPGAGYPATTMEAGAPADQGMSAANETSMGAQISSFMQSSAAEAEGNVESSMWQVRFENAPEERRGKLVKKRVESLEKRLQRLEERRAELLAGDDVTVAERARAARLAAQAESLREAIDNTAEAAEETGVETEKLDDLRTRARNVTGEKVAEMAPGVGEDGAPPAGPRSDRDGETAEPQTPEKGDAGQNPVTGTTTLTAVDGTRVSVTTGNKNTPVTRNRPGTPDGSRTDVTGGNHPILPTGLQPITPGEHQPATTDGQSDGTDANGNVNTGTNASGGVNVTNVTNASGVTGTDAPDLSTT